MPATKGKVAPTQVARLVLPKNFRPSDNERAVASRLIRALRESDYWLGAFVEWLLYIDASGGVERITVAEVKKELELHSTARGTDEDWRKKLMAAHPEVFAKTASRDAAAKQCESFPDDEEEQFYQLLKQWRLTYPEPSSGRIFQRAELSMNRTRTQTEASPLGPLPADCLTILWWLHRAGLRIGPLC